MKEQWKHICGYEGMYKVSTLGRVRSLSRFNSRTDRILKKTICDGYERVNLSKDNIQNNEFVHRLVAMAFIDNPENKPCVNHISGIRNDNRVENLEWVTHQENDIHAVSIGLKPRGERCVFSKLKEEDVYDIINCVNMGCFTRTELSEAFNISRRSISKILNGENWKHITRGLT